MPLCRYSKVVLAMGTREKAAATDFSTFLDDDTEHALKETAAVSMGTEISGEDLSNMQALARQCVELSQYRHARLPCSFNPARSEINLLSQGATF